jgi:hypothetical protein
MIHAPSISAAILFTLASLTATANLSAQNLSDTASAASTAAPYAEVQSSTLSGSTNVINLTMVPVVLANGSIAYKNVTVPLEVTENAAGVVTITSGTVTAVASTPGPVNGFKAGTYYGPASSATTPTQAFVLAGPGTTTGGSTEWSLAVSPTAKGCTYPYSATFYVASSLTSNPLYARLKAAGITSTGYSYGILGTYSCENGWWSSGAIVGFSQIGNTVSIVSFSNGTDHSTPGTQITFTY